jgi:hypothetical protein
VGCRLVLSLILVGKTDMKEKLAQLLKEKRQALGHESIHSESNLGGRVGQFSDPMRSHIKFELRTYEQEKDLYIRLAYI